MSDDTCYACAHSRVEHETDGCNALVEVSHHEVTWDECCGCPEFEPWPVHDSDTEPRAAPEGTGGSEP
jgi:hypothetical protein